MKVGLCRFLTLLNSNQFRICLVANMLIRYNIFRKFKKVQKDRHAQKTLVE